MNAAPAETPKIPDFPQRADVVDRSSGENYSQVCLGPIEELGRYGIRHPLIGATAPGKVFLHQLLGLSGMEISYGLLPPRTSFPFYHKHKQNEEAYLFLSGAGEFRVDDDIMPIREGSVVRVATEGVRCWRNTSAEPMFYICVQAKQGSLEQWTGTDGVGVPGEVTWPN